MRVVLTEALHAWIDHRAGGKGALASSFGAAGSLVALLLWVYCSAQTFFLGAEFTRRHALRFGSPRRVQEGDSRCSSA